MARRAVFFFKQEFGVLHLEHWPYSVPGQGGGRGEGARKEQARTQRRSERAPFL